MKFKVREQVLVQAQQEQQEPLPEPVQSHPERVLPEE